MTDWKPISTCPDGRAIETCIYDRKYGRYNEQVLVKRGKLFWAGDIYVYYTPTHWREIAQ